MTEKTFTITIDVTYDVENDEQAERVKTHLDDLPMFLNAVSRLEGDTDVPMVTYDHQVEDNHKLVKRMLDVSMVHVPEAYRAPEVKLPYKLADHDFGFFCWVPYKDYANTPLFMEPFIELAHSKGCAVINFDNEGQVIAGLPTYDKAWVGPKTNPMAAIIACNNEGEYVDPTHLANAAVEVLASLEFFDEGDFCAAMAQRANIVAQRRVDGWYAAYDDLAKRRLDKQLKDQK